MYIWEAPEIDSKGQLQYSDSLMPHNHKDVYKSTSAASLCWLPYLTLADSRPFPVPDELRSDRFNMTLDGQAAAVAHAATTYHFANSSFAVPRSYPAPGQMTITGHPA